MPMPLSYHDLYVTTARFPRTALFDLPFRVLVICSRVTGWQAWGLPEGSTDPGGVELPEELLGGEYEPDCWLVLDVAGLVICDSRPEVRAAQHAPSLSPLPPDQEPVEADLLSTAQRSQRDQR